VPGLAIRSTFIVGYPGEKKEHFSVLLDFLKEARLDHVGAFTYSREEGTGAHALGDPVDRRTKIRRQEKILEVQQAISWEKNRVRLGQRLEVLVEGVCEETEHLLQGRLATQAPDIDGRVLINDGFAAPGTFARVQITEAHPYDLVGGIV
jgi:ribosomal protein S12 methylthiotransferase